MTITKPTNQPTVLIQYLYQSGTRQIFKGVKITDCATTSEETKVTSMADDLQFLMDVDFEGFSSESDSSDTAFKENQEKKKAKRKRAYRFVFTSLKKSLETLAMVGNESLL